MVVVTEGVSNDRGRQFEDVPAQCADSAQPGRNAEVVDQVAQGADAEVRGHAGVYQGRGRVLVTDLFLHYLEPLLFSVL
uniref:hypothetical protein n=1 Tax=Nocardia jiangxiensis TaxID=282685 RepID=UPI0012F663D3